MGTSSWDPSRDAIAEVLIASHGFESTRHGFTTVRCHKVDSAIARDQKDRLVAPSSILEVLRIPATGNRQRPR